MRLFTQVLDLNFLETGSETESRVKNGTNKKTGKKIL